MAMFLLFESASGYALFERLESQEIAALETQENVTDFARFAKFVKFKSFVPFTSAQSALENVNAVSEGTVTALLRDFLETNLPKSKKSSKVVVGVQEDKLATAVQEALGVTAQKQGLMELFRGLRLHLEKYIKELRPGDLEKTQLGVGHHYSRGKVKFNVNRVDNMIIQSIALLDNLDKALNTFAMRVREWYSWHFPELVRIVPDNIMFARLAKRMRNKDSLTEDDVADLAELLDDEDKAAQVYAAAQTSMGTDVSAFDMRNIETFADKVISLADYRARLHHYLQKKMHDVAPNLSALIGEVVGARLISHAGSLTSLAKYPASTVQILGAEKALFRALKAKGGKTPKYGLIFNSTFIGRASAKNKGRMSRYLANKCTIASRIDAFSDVATPKFGERLRGQVEDRLKFYDTGETPRKNIDVMHEVIAEVERDFPELRQTASAGKKRKSADDDDDDKKKKSSSSKKEKKKSSSKKDDLDDSDSDAMSEDEKPSKKSKKHHESPRKEKKEKKKEKKESSGKEKKSKKH